MTHDVSNVGRCPRSISEGDQQLPRLNTGITVSRSETKIQPDLAHLLLIHTSRK